MVEHKLPKLGVAGSNPVSRSTPLARRADAELVAGFNPGLHASRRALGGSTSATLELESRLPLNAARYSNPVSRSNVAGCSHASSDLL